MCLRDRYGPGVDEDLLARMKEEIGQIKEINVELTVEQATEKQMEVSVEIAVSDGYSYDCLLYTSFLQIVF